MNAIESLAPDQGSEQRKFYQALTALSRGFKGSSKALEALSLFASMPLDRLREEAELRGFVQHPTESIADFRLRVARSEEWQILAGSKLGLKRFLDYLGYKAYRFERVRDRIPERWNEVNLYLKTTRSTLVEAQYLDFLLDQLKPAIVVFRTYYYGRYRLVWIKPVRMEGDGIGYVHGQSRLPQNPTFRVQGRARGVFRLPDFKQYDMDTYESYDQ